VSGEGMEELKFAVAKLVATHRPIAVDEPAAATKKRKPLYPPPASSARGRA
jgi:GTP-binding protein